MTEFYRAIIGPSPQKWEENSQTLSKFQIANRKHLETVEIGDFWIADKYLIEI